MKIPSSIFETYALLKLCHVCLHLSFYKSNVIKFFLVFQIARGVLVIVFSFEA